MLETYGANKSYYMKRKGAMSGSELRKKIEKRNLYAIQNEHDRKIKS